MKQTQQNSIFTLEYWDTSVLGGLVLFFLLLLVYLQTLTNNMVDFDLWGRMAAGRLFVENRAVPVRDIFSYLPTREHWIQHGWLTNVLLFQLNSAFAGGAGLQLLRWGLILGTVVFSYATAKGRGGSRTGIILCLLLVRDVYSFGSPVIRAQSFTYFFFPVFIWWLERTRSNGRWSLLWLLAPLLWLWANLHPGYLSGIGIMVLYAAGQWRTPKKAGFILAVAATGLALSLINPYGLDYLRETIGVSSTPSAEVTEWLPVWVTLFGGERQNISLVFVLLLAITVVLALWRRRLDLAAGLVLGVTAVLALQHNRHIVFFALAFVLYVPAMLRESLQSLAGAPHALRTWPKHAALLIFSGYFVWCLAPVPAFLSAHLLPNPRVLLQAAPLMKRQVPRGSAYYPVEALFHLRKHNLKGNLATHLAWGGLMIWGAYPNCKVAFDGRNESVYTLEARKLFYQFITNGKNWREFLRRYPTQLLILKPWEKIAKTMSREPGWTALYQDAGSVLLARNFPGGLRH